jgi:hypothetical protein
MGGVGGRGEGEGCTLGLRREHYRMYNLFGNLTFYNTMAPISYDNPIRNTINIDVSVMEELERKVFPLHFDSTEIPADLKTGVSIVDRLLYGDSVPQMYPDVWPSFRLETHSDCTEPPFLLTPIHIFPRTRETQDGRKDVTYHGTTILITNDHIVIAERELIRDQIAAHLYTILSTIVLCLGLPIFTAVLMQ